MSRIIYKRLDANHELIFRKFEKEINVCTKLSADIQFLLLLYEYIPPTVRKQYYVSVFLLDIFTNYN